MIVLRDKDNVEIRDLAMMMMREFRNWEMNTLAGERITSSSQAPVNIAQELRVVHRCSGLFLETDGPDPPQVLSIPRK